MSNGQWAVSSGQWAVGSKQWASCQYRHAVAGGWFVGTTSELPLPFGKGIEGKGLAGHALSRTLSQWEREISVPPA